MQANAPQEIENIDSIEPADGRRTTDNSTYKKVAAFRRGRD